MAERSQDLEMYRERFLNQLHLSQPEMQGHQEFIQYWKVVEREAKQTEELGKLEEWVKNLARDKDRVNALRQRLEAQKDTEAGAGAMAILQIIMQILMLLDDIEKKIRKRRDARRRVLGWLVFRAGPGMKPKQEPQDETKGEKDEEVSETVLAKPKADDEKKKKPQKKLAR